MEINIGNFGNMGIRPETFGAGGVDAKSETPAASGGVCQPTNLIIGEGAPGLAAAEPVADVPESALTRDDDLGRLVDRAFSLPPPPMPAFID